MTYKSLVDIINGNNNLKEFYEEKKPFNLFTINGSNDNILEINNYTELSDVRVLKKLCAENIKLSFREYLTQQELNTLINSKGFLHIKGFCEYMYQIDNTILDYINNNAFVLGFLDCSKEFQQHFFLKNKNNYSLLEKIFKLHFTTDWVTPKDYLVLVENLGVDFLLNNPTILELVFRNVPYLLVQIKDKSPNSLNNLDFNRWLDDEFFEYFLVRPLKYSLCAYMYIMGTKPFQEIKNDLKALSKYERTIIFDNFLLSIEEEYEDYMQKGIDWFIMNKIKMKIPIIRKKVGNRAFTIKFTKLLRNEKVGLLLANKQSFIADIVENMMTEDISEADWLYYYRLRQWDINTMDKLRRRVACNDMPEFLEVLNQDIAKLLKYSQNPNEFLEYYKLHIEEYLEDLKIIKLVLSNTRDIDLTYKIISQIDHKLLTDQEIIAALVASVDYQGKYKYYYFNNAYTAFVFLYIKNPFFHYSYEWSIPMQNDVMLFSAFVDLKMPIDKRFNTETVNRYLEKIVSTEDKKVEIRKIVNTNFYIVNTIDKKQIIKLLSFITKHKVVKYYRFKEGDQVITWDIKTYCEILKQSKWPFLYLDTTLQASFHLYSLNQVYDSNELEQIIDIYTQNMIKYAGKDFLEYLDSDFFFPALSVYRYTPNDDYQASSSSSYPTMEQYLKAIEQSVPYKKYLSKH